MEYRPDLKIAFDKEVYPPSEDSILLIESLDIRQGERVLEIGSGSGIVSIHCVLNGGNVMCGDINPHAAKLSCRNAGLNGVVLKVRVTDLFSSFPERFDTVIFNLPYLPVQEEGELAKAWSGGEDGLGPLPDLLAQCPDHLLEDGRLVVVVSSLMNQEKLETLLRPYRGKVLGELKLFFEVLRVLEIKF